MFTYKNIKTAALVTLFTAASMLAAGGVMADEGGNEPLQIVTTIFPEYDWIMNILGDNPGGAEVTMLLDSGVDLHSFQPTAQDILKIANCDLFVYVGGESDEWVEDALKESINPDQVVVNLLDVLGEQVKEEELVEGMEEHEHEEGEAEEGGEEEAEYDEHVWLSLKNAGILCNALAEELGALDASHATFYGEQAASYLDQLGALDQAYEEAVDAAPVKTLLFADRFPFRYMTDDYGLTYYAAFAGCSAETEASFETVAFLAGKVDELGLSTIMTIEGTDHRIAETVKSSTKEKNQKILSLNSLQSVTAKDVEAGASYLSIMEDNLEVLKEALQ